MKTVFTVFIFCSIFSQLSSAQLVLDFSDNDLRHKNRVYLDGSTFKEIIEASPDVSVQERAKKMSEFFLSAPFIFTDLKVQFNGHDGRSNNLRRHPRISINYPISETFVATYFSFFANEVENIVKLAPKIMPYEKSGRARHSPYIKQEFYSCVQSMAIDSTQENCLAKVRPHLVNDNTILFSFVNSYIKLYRATRFNFVNTPFFDHNQYNYSYSDTLRQAKVACDRASGLYLSLEQQRAQFVTNPSTWSGLEQLHNYEALPTSDYIDGATFPFKMRPQEITYQGRTSVRACSIPYFSIFARKFLTDDE